MKNQPNHDNHDKSIHIVIDLPNCPNRPVKLSKNVISTCHFATRVQRNNIYFKMSKPDAAAISLMKTRELLEDLQAHGVQGDVTYNKLAHSALTDPNFLDEVLVTVFLLLVYWIDCRGNQFSRPRDENLVNFLTSVCTDQALFLFFFLIFQFQLPTPALVPSSQDSVKPSPKLPVLQSLPQTDTSMQAQASDNTPVISSQESNPMSLSGEEQSQTGEAGFLTQEELDLISQFPTINPTVVSDPSLKADVTIMDCREKFPQDLEPAPHRRTCSWTGIGL